MEEGGGLPADDPRRAGETASATATRLTNVAMGTILDETESVTSRPIAR